MSLGFIPILITLVLSLMTSQNIAIYIGSSIGLIASLYFWIRKGVKIPKFILLFSTGVLLILTLATFIYNNYCPYGYLPITIEVSVFIGMAILYLHKRRFINFLIKRQGSCNKHFYIQAAESTIVSARIFLLVAATHFVMMGFFGVLSQNLFEYRHILLYNVLPPIVFIITIIFNEIAIYYFNRITKHIEYLPIVNVNGTVIGKTLAIDALNYKNKYINPVIRIAAISNGKLYLCSRSNNCIIEKNKLDIPMECYLRYGESLEEGAIRLLKNTFPKIKEHTPIFNLVYHYDDEKTSRLNYLFLVDIEDQSLLDNPNFKSNKLWSLEELDRLIQTEEVSLLLKQEYQQIKNIIYTREKYKES